MIRDFDKICMGVVGEGNYYYPVCSQEKVYTNKIKGLLPGTYIDFNYKPVKFTDDEKLALLLF